MKLNETKNPRNSNNNNVINIEMLSLLRQSLKQLQLLGDNEPTFLTRKIEKLIK